MLFRSYLEFRKMGKVQGASDSEEGSCFNDMDLLFWISEVVRTLVLIPTFVLCGKRGKA
jgi:hypothetical protein